MKYKELEKENKRLTKALGIANRTVFEQMEEIKTLNNICEFNDAHYKREIDRLNDIIEYLESKRC